MQNFIKIKLLNIFAHNNDYNKVLYKRAFYDFCIIFIVIIYSQLHIFYFVFKITFYNNDLYIIVFKMRYIK